MDLEYKTLRESFIRGLNGSTAQEVLVLTTYGPISNCLFLVIFSLISNLAHLRLGIRLLIEPLFIFGPFLLAVTILHQHINALIILMICVILILVFVLIIFPNEVSSKRISLKELLEMPVRYETRQPFITDLMSSLMMCVCVAILAVDFPIFSRRFAKTEMYGWSLMDVGVGGFIAVNGGLSPESRLGTEGGYKPRFLIKKTFYSIIPLIVLGFQRLAMVKGLNYHEHITEYGLHWNFFFTIAFTKMFSTIFCCVSLSRIRVGIVAFVLLIVHQYLLTYQGLTDFILNDDREGLFAANKEGIISIFGYLSLHLLFVEIAKFALKERDSHRQWLKLALQLWFISAFFALLMFLSHNYVEEISRREANFAFVCWMSSFICFLAGIEIFIQSSHQMLQNAKIVPMGQKFSSMVFNGIGFSSMLLFLFANVLTGVVNLSVDTLAVSTSTAIFILLLYCYTLSCFAVFCLHKKIQLKLPVKHFAGDKRK